MRSHVDVETQYGTLRGEVDAAGSCQFKGIPFAAPPVGDLRFLPPEPVRPWPGIRAALEFGPSCPQRNVAGPLGEMIGIAPGTTSEDCLYLNIWTPGVRGPLRPVLVWVHGGGNLVGSGSQPRMNGTHLSARGDVVVVTFNYRLGALGFLHAPEIGASGNQALLDQVGAFRFVRDQIAAFGGDPENVTVFGQSAGGFDLAELLALPHAPSCFDKAILMSGSVRPHVDRERAARTAEALAEPFGGIERLRDVPVESLVARQAELARSALSGEHRFAPTRDGEIITGDVLDSIREGRHDRGIPLLLGTTRHEWNLFSAFDPSSAELDVETVARRMRPLFPGDVSEAIHTYSEELAKADSPVNPLALWNAFMTDESFRIPAVRVAERHATHTRETFVYRFDRESPALDGRLRAYHSIDVPFVFGTHRLQSLERLLGRDRAMDALSARVMDAWIAFARRGDPATQSSDDWPAYSAAKRSVMCLGDDCEIRTDPSGHTRELWAAAPDGAVSP